MNESSSKHSKIRNIDTIYARLHKYLVEVDPPTSNYSQQTKEQNYSLKQFVLGAGNQFRVLISAGIHGDEPSGVETICALIENDILINYTDDWEIILLPCLNPYGYERGMRENHEGIDLNRSFRNESPPQEVVFAQSIFDKEFDLTIELHEDDESKGYYLYQKGDHLEDDVLGPQIIHTVKKIIPINDDSEIDGHISKAGIVTTVEDYKTMDWWPMTLFSISKNSRRCFTLESPTALPLEKRVAAHISAVEMALNYFTKVFAD